MLTEYFYFLQNAPDNRYTCVCPLGFHGKHCQMSAKTCADKPCRNGALCSNNPLSEVGYQCRCPANYDGVNCDVPIDSCRLSPCDNGGTCQLKYGSLDDYECRCPVGFTGKNCQINVDDCALNPCQNGGTCLDFVNDYKCYCTQVSKIIIIKFHI